MPDLHLSEKLPSDAEIQSLCLKLLSKDPSLTVDEKKHDAQRLLEYAKRYGQKEWYAIAMFHISYFTSVLENNYDLAIAQCQEALQIFLQFENDRYAAMSYMSLSNFYLRKFDYRSALQAIEKQIPLTRKHHNVPSEIAAMINRGRIHRYMGNYEKALQDLQEALRLSYTANYDGTRANIFINLCAIYGDIQDYPKCIKTADEGLALAGICKNKREYAALLLNKSSALGALKRYDEAIEIGLQGIDVLKELNDQWTLSSAMQVLGQLYVGVNRYEQAVDAFEKSLQHARASGHKNQEATTLVSLSQVLCVSGDRNRAMSAAKAAEEVATQIDDKRNLYGAHISLSEIYEQLGDHAQALFHFKRYHALKEEMFNEESGKRLKNLQVLHDVEQARLKERESIRSKLHSDVLSAIVRIHRWSVPLCESLDDLPEALRDSVELIYETSKSLDVKVRHFQFGLSEKAKSVYEVCKHLEKISREILEDVARLDVLGIGQEMREVEMAADARDAVVDITQLAMTNIWKHAGAAQVILQFAITGEGFEMNIRDDGKGFNVESVPAIGGVSDMKMLAEQVGAKLKMTTTLKTPVNSGGTQIFFSLPLTKLKGTQTFSE